VIRILAMTILCMHLLTPIAAWAQAASRNPLDYSLKQYLLVLGFALLGGLVGWYNKVRSGVIPGWSINHLVGELCTSAFAGLMTFWVCEWMNFAPLLTAALTGVMGHMGTRAVTMLEEFATKRFSANVGGGAP
jgi:hypothetical protein